MQSGLRTMKSLCSTRWSSRADNCAVILNTLPIIVSTLEQITTDSSYDRETASDAFSLLKAVDFNFCLCLTVMHDMLLLCNVLSKTLQQQDIDISAATIQLKSLIKTIADSRNETSFHALWVKAESVADSIGVFYSQPRQRKVSKRIDENWATQVHLSGEEKSRSDFYYATIDLLLSALNTRFHEDVLPLLSSLDCQTSPSILQVDKLRTLSLFYPRDIDVDTESFVKEHLKNETSIPYISI